MKVSNEVKVGILITATLAAVLWGLNYLKGKDLFTSRNKYYAIYTGVDGLVKSNPVFMNGFNVGIVDNIAFVPDKSGKLLVTLLVDKNIFVARNSVAVIFDSDLIGTKGLRIDLGNDPIPLPENDTLRAELDGGLTAQLGPIKDKTEHLIQSIDTVVNMLHSLFDPNTKDNLREGIKHLNGTLASVDEMVSSDKSKLRLMLANFESISENLKANNTQINSIIDNLASVSDTLARVKFASTIANADRVLVETSMMIEKINKGEGSFGKLVNNDSLYNNLDSSAKSLDELLKDLKANPKRYVHFSIFGKKQ